MNKHHHFWLERWQSNDIPFHQLEPNADLDKFWHQLNLDSSSSVLVPLCGKSLDMVWLSQQGCYVIGIELSQLAVEQFFSTINMPYHIERHGNFSIYKNDNYEIWLGDIFRLDNQSIPKVDAIYDRGSLIALPYKIRQKYVPHIYQWLKDQGRVLLKTAVYDQQDMQGPPYSVSEQEILALYEQFSSITKVKSNARTPEQMQRYIARGCKAFTDETWIITK